MSAADTIDGRFLVVDDRRMRVVVFDTRVLADRVMDPVTVVAYLSVAWHSDMRSFSTPLKPKVVAAYAGCSTRTAERALGRAVEAGYVSRQDRPGKPSLYDLQAVREFPLPLWPSPWRSRTGPRSPGERVDAPDAQGDHRWLVNVDPRMNPHVIVDCRILADTQLDAQAIATYLGLLWHRGHRSGTAWPSQATLGSYTGFWGTTGTGETKWRPTNHKAVSAATEQLIEAGYVSKRTVPGEATVFTLLELPEPEGPSIWTPDTKSEVSDPGARETPDGLGTREEGSWGPLARDWAPSTGPPTPDTKSEVFSTTPDTKSEDPRHQVLGTNTPPTNPPSPRSARSDDDRSPSRQGSRAAGGGRANRAIAAGQARATHDWTNRAVTVARRFAPEIADDPGCIDDTIDALCREIRGSRNGHLVDVDHVIDVVRTVLAEHHQGQDR